MSSIPQITDNGNNVSDFATKFMKRFHISSLLFKCNAGKKRYPGHGYLPVSLLHDVRWQEYLYADKDRHI